MTIHADNSITVVDDGRGIPVAMMEKEGRPAVEVVLTVLHSGGKFGDGGGYKVSGGLHGVGVSVVNALSERLDIEIRRDGFVWTQNYSRGAPQDALRGARRSRRARRPARASPSCPTPRSSSRSISTSATLEERLRETAFLTRGLRISLTDERGDGSAPTSTTRAGSRTTSSFLNESKEPIGRKVIFFERRGRRGRRRGRDAVELLLPGVDLLVRQQHQHARGRQPPDRLPLGADAHGQQVRARQGLLKEKDESLAGEDVREGLTAVISAKLRDPQFEGQTKTKLGNPGMAGFVESSSTPGSPSSSRRTRARRAPRSARPSRRRAPARPPARRAT